MTLDEALKRKQKLEKTLQRLQGRLDVAKSDKLKLDAQIREKGYDPDDLDGVIDRLSDQKTKLLEQLETHLQEAEQNLLTYMEK
jgi:TATA-box binding protein (TBP) (component of TFIID and TFIIIB)